MWRERERKERDRRADLAAPADKTIAVPSFLWMCIPRASMRVRENDSLSAPGERARKTEKEQVAALSLWLRLWHRSYLATSSRARTFVRAASSLHTPFSPGFREILNEILCNDDDIHTSLACASASPLRDDHFTTRVYRCSLSLFSSSSPPKVSLCENTLPIRPFFFGCLHFKTISREQSLCPLLTSCIFLLLCCRYVSHWQADVILKRI